MWSRFLWHIWNIQPSKPFEGLINTKSIYLSYCLCIIWSGCTNLKLRIYKRVHTIFTLNKWHLLSCSPCPILFASRCSSIYLFFFDIICTTNRKIVFDDILICINREINCLWCCKLINCKQPIILCCKL